MTKYWTLCSILFVVVLSGCGDPIGTACTIRGSGFTASHDCRNKCLMYNKVRCPDASVVVPKVCSGIENCKIGGCPTGQVCYFEDDATDERSYCILADTCGQQTDTSLSQWERDSFNLAAQTRKAWAEKFNRIQPAIPTKPPTTNEG